MVRSLGCDWALVGHSERRTLYDEGDDVCNQKVLRCLAQDGLKVILCVGETLEEYESDLLETIVSLQVRKGLAGVDVAEPTELRSFEPVWAIGTGRWRHRNKRKPRTSPCDERCPKYSELKRLGVSASSTEDRSRPSPLID